MSLEIDGRVIVSAEFREHAVADGQGAWIVSIYPRRLFTRSQAITGRWRCPDGGRLVR